MNLLQNQGHEQGGCLVPVTLLEQNGFQTAGITVYFKEEASTVSQAVQQVIDGKAQVFGPAQTCGGHGDHGHGHGGPKSP